MFEVLKSFKYSADGLNVVDLQKGQIVEICDGICESLTNDGFIRFVKKPTPKIEVPKVELETKPMPTRRRSTK